MSDDDGQLTGSERLIQRIRLQVEDPDEYGPIFTVGDLDKIFNLNRENVQLLSMWIRGQPAPDAVAAKFLVKEEEDASVAVGDVVKELIGDEDDRIQLQVSVERWPGGSYGVTCMSIPYPGGQPTPDAISRRS